MDQDTLARLQPSHVAKREGGGHVGDREGGTVGERERLGEAGDEAGVAGRVATEGASRQGHDAVADLQLRDAGADGHDRAGALAAERTGIARIHPEHVQHVLEIDGGGVHVDLDLGRRRRPTDGRPPHQVVEAAALVEGDLERLRHRRWPRRREPGGQAATVAERQLVFSTGTGNRGEQVARPRWDAGSVSRSTHNGASSGYSRATVLANPHTRAASGAVTGAPAGCAPRVTKHVRGARPPLASARVRCRALPSGAFARSRAVAPAAGARSRGGGRGSGRPAVASAPAPRSLSGRSGRARSGPRRACGTRRPASRQWRARRPLRPGPRGPGPPGGRRGSTTAGPGGHPPPAQGGASPSRRTAWPTRRRVHRQRRDDMRIDESVGAQESLPAGTIEQQLVRA